LLKLLCDVFKLRQEIPKNKGELFQWVDEEYDRLKGMPTLAPELRHWKAELLQQLAFEMMRGNDPTKLNLTILRTDAIAIFESFLQERGVSDFGQKARTLLEDLQKYHLLQPTANQKIEFHHQLFQEYYAAEYLLRRFASWNDGVLQQEYLNYLKWTEPLALMLGLVEDKDQALRVVRSALDVDLKLGARLAGEVKQKFQPHAVSDTMQKFSSDFPKEPSWLKLKLLRQIGKAAIYELIPLLDDPSPSIRYHAYRTLRFIAPEEIPEQCRAREDFNWNPQRLERNPESLEPEEPLIQQDSDSSVSREVTEASHTIDSQAIALGLLKVMMSHPESFVRYEAVLGLGELSRKDDIAKFLSETHLQELVQQLEDSYIYTRWSIALMLWNIASEEVIPLLRPKLDHSNPDIALSAALILGKFGCSAAVPRLVEMMDYSNLSNHPNVQDISYLAGYALGQVKDNVTSEYLPKLLTLVSTQSGADVFQAIASIQERCQYYNYELEEKRKAIATQTDAEERSVEQPIPNKYYIIAEVAQIIEGNKGNIIGKRDHKAE
jgi:HEAT repeat protein